MAPYYDTNITYSRNSVSKTMAVKYFKATPADISVYGAGGAGITASTAKS